MTDAHIHIEKGPYTLEWVNEFVKVALSRGIDEIYLLEHCYRFKEFVPMYCSISGSSDHIDAWLSRKSGVLDLSDYQKLIEKVRKCSWPIKIKFGLEICHFEEYEEFIKTQTSGKGFDFLTGSVHFIDTFAFDHKTEFWNGRDVDVLYRRYFEISAELAGCGLYSGIAHPDCIKIFGHKPSFDLSPYYEKLAEALSKSGMYAEQSSGINRRTGAEIGMDSGLLAAIKRHNVKILPASDAHRPEDVGYKLGEAEQLASDVK